jgi:hypothetical protein
MQHDRAHLQTQPSLVELVVIHGELCGGGERVGHAYYQSEAKVRSGVRGTETQRNSYESLSL